MSQENIWQATLKDEVNDINHNKGILIRRNFPFELNMINLRNYFNVHDTKDICVSSMYDYFKDNMFKDFEGYYLPHMLCAVPYISIEKILKALDEVLEVINPNLGSNTEYNINYFQYHMLTWGRNELFYLRKFKEFYEIGLKHGLDKNYIDMMTHSSLEYFFAFAPINIIENEFELFLNDRKVSKENAMILLEKRIEKYSTCFLQTTKERLVHDYKIFKLLYEFGFYPLGYAQYEDKDYSKITKEYECYERIKRKINNIQM